jgi:hypothetical protein
MRHHNLQVTGSVVVNGLGLATTADLTSYTASADAKISTLQSFTASVGTTNTFTASASSRLSSIETITASNVARLNAVETITSSNVARLNSIETITSSNVARLTSLEIRTGSLATTGSNTFIGTQIFSGSLYVQDNLVVQGSSSLQNITASAVSIGTNTVLLNTANPSVRFGGISVVDSGSAAGKSGSLYFDSTDDEWIFVHQGNTAVTSSIMITGPETYNNIGNETKLTINTIPKVQSGFHLYDSCISDNGTTVILKSNVEVTGSLSIMGDGAVLNRVSSGEPYIFFRKDGVNRASIYGNSGGGLRIFDQSDNQILTITSSFTGVGTSSPCQKLHVFGAGDSTKVRFELYGQAGVNEVLQLANTANFNPGRGVKIGLYVNCCTNASQLGAEIGATTVSGDNHGASLFFNTTYAGTSYERLRITNTGCVGIGTTLPIASLQICAPDSQFRISGDTRAQMILGTSVKAWQIETSCAAGNVQGCAFGIVESGAGVRFQILSGGKVGINKTPVAYLDICGGNDGDQMISIGSNSVSGIISTPSNMYINADSDNDSSSGTMTFGFNRTGYTGGTSVMTILENCNVGLSQTSPQTNLHMYTAGQPNTVCGLYANMILQTDSQGNYQRIRFDRDSCPFWGLGVEGANSSNDFILSGLIGGKSGVWADCTFRIKNSNGNVAIRCSSPGVSLVVGGTDAIKMPAGTTAERPTGAAGLIRFNTTTNISEYHDGTNWVGFSEADPYWNNVVLYLRGGSLTDLKARHTVTAVNVSTSSSPGKPFANAPSTAWYLVNGGSNNYLDVAGNLADFGPFAYTDFTIEFWLHHTASSGQYGHFYNIGGQGSNGVIKFLDSAGYGIYWYSGNGELINWGTSFAANTWVHVVYEKYGSTNTTWLNGTRVSQNTNTLPNSTPPYLRLGGPFNAEYSPHYFDELRVTTAARYKGVSSIQVQTKPYPSPS